jgi:hypothetical protein
VKPHQMQCEYVVMINQKAAGWCERRKELISLKH